MDINWYGQACFKIKTKYATIVVDPFSPEFTGLKLPKDLTCDLALSTHSHEDHNNFNIVGDVAVKITGPGEYEAKGISVIGVPVFHDKQEGKERGKNTIYNILADNLNIVHLGDLGHVLSDAEVDEIGSCDVLLIPVGGVFTVDAKDATAIVAQLEPKIIVPMHYSLPNLKFQLDPLENFLKEMGVEEQAAQPKLTITKDKLPDEPQVIVLNTT